MHSEVRNHFATTIDRWEGRIPYMYLDQEGLVSIGVGTNINDGRILDGLLARGITFTFKSRPGIARPGAPASGDEIRQEWTRVKTKREWIGRHANFDHFTQLELRSPQIDAAVQLQLDDIEKDIWGTFRGMDDWPADAQLGLFIMLWALGTQKFRAQFRNFMAAARATPPNWRRAANESGFRTVFERRTAIRQLFDNAARVDANPLLPRHLLYYPRVPPGA